jgi:hypothetical protein
MKIGYKKTLTAHDSGELSKYQGGICWEIPPPPFRRAVNVKYSPMSLEGKILKGEIRMKVEEGKLLKGKMKF